MSLEYAPFQTKTFVCLWPKSIDTLNLLCSVVWEFSIDSLLSVCSHRFYAMNVAIYGCYGTNGSSGRDEERFVFFSSVEVNKL